MGASNPETADHLSLISSMLPPSGFSANCRTRTPEERYWGGRQPPLTAFLILPYPSLCLCFQAYAGEDEARKVSGLAGALDYSPAFPPLSCIAWGPQPLCPDAFGLLQEETQGQGEEEEREAETHRLPPVSVRRGIPGMARRLGQREARTYRGQWSGRESKAQLSLGSQNRELHAERLQGPGSVRGPLFLS